MSHFDQDKRHCEEPFGRLRMNSATKQSPTRQEIASLPSVARNDRM
jgi:hypothetical protein